MADLAVIVVNYNTAHLLGEMFAALERAAADLDCQVILVDNASRDDSRAVIERDHPHCRLIANAVNVGFGRANNQGMALADAPYVLLLNTDAFVAPDTLRQTLAHMAAHPRCGILGVKLLGRDGALQPSCRYFPTPWNTFLWRTGLNRLFPRVRLVDDPAWDHAAPRACDWVPGAFYLIRQEVLQQVGPFDPRYFLYYEEVDHCRAAKRAGWEVHCYPQTSAVHIGGESANSEGELTASGRQLDNLNIESELLYFRKNHGLSGVLSSVALRTIEDLFMPLKRWLKGRPAGWQRHGRHIGLVWSLFLKTHWATRPTR